MSNSLPFPADFLLAQRCLEGETEAIAQFQETYRPVLMAYLQSAGARETEAEEVTEGLWADCLMERPRHRPRLATYGGQSSLKTWLYPLALNRLIARKRSEGSWSKILQDGLDLERIEAAAASSTWVDSEIPLMDLMREAVEAGFRGCSAEEFVLLQLAHLDRLRLAELALMFDCSTSKIDRDIETARKKVEEATLEYIRGRDSWLDLKWDDFVELCRVASPACLGVD